jgi:hypothetical protein
MEEIKLNCSESNNLDWHLKISEGSLSRKDTIHWRGVELHIYIYLSRPGVKYVHQSIHFNHDNNIYECVLDYNAYGQRKRGTPPPKLETDKHYLEITIVQGRLILFDRPKNKDLSERKTNEKIFEIYETPDDVQFYLPKVRAPEPIRFVIETNQVTLYEYKDANTNINSFAFFADDELKIDRWVLTDRYEDEYTVSIKEEGLSKLDSFFNGATQAELLIGLHNAFKGEKAYTLAKKWLNENNIEYQEWVRRDQRD